MSENQWVALPGHVCSAAQHMHSNIVPAVDNYSNVYTLQKKHFASQLYFIYR